MNSNLLLRGFILGFSIAAPVGPIGVLCIRRTLSDGQISGFVSGLGAATADAIYGAIAGLGLTAIAGLLVQQQNWLQFTGGAFLLYLGVKTLTSKKVEMEIGNQKQSWIRAYISTFILTLTNPMTILSFTAIIASAGLGNSDGDYSKAIILILGVFGGSALWWLLLSAGVGLFRKTFSSNSLRWINRLSGTVIAVFGLVSLVSSMI